MYVLHTPACLECGNSFATAAITPLRCNIPVISYSEPNEKYHRGGDNTPSYTRGTPKYVTYKTQPLHYEYVPCVVLTLLLLCSRLTYKLYLKNISCDIGDTLEKIFFEEKTHTHTAVKPRQWKRKVTIKKLNSKDTH